MERMGGVREDASSPSTACVHFIGLVDHFPPSWPTSPPLSPPFQDYNDIRIFGLVLLIALLVIVVQVSGRSLAHRGALRSRGPSLL